MSELNTYTKQVVSHCKLILRSDRTHSIPAIVARVIWMLDQVGMPERDFQRDLADAELYAYRAFLIDGQAAA